MTSTAQATRARLWNRAENPRHRVAVNPVENLLTIEKAGGNQVSYDPKRLSGVTVYREAEREFSVGERIQFTAPNKQLGVANRELGIIEKIDERGDIALRLEDGRAVQFNAVDHRHLDHGYAVTSHSSQGLTSDRVLVNIDTSVNPQLLNSRFAYVAVSRASFDAQIYTNDAANLGRALSCDVSKSSAVDFFSLHSSVHNRRSFHDKRWVEPRRLRLLFFIGIGQRQL